MILLVFFFASGGHTRSFLNEAEGGGRRKTVERKRNQKPLGLPPLLAAAERSRHIAGRKDVPPQPQCAQPYHSRPGCGRVRAKGPRTRGRIRIESRDSRGGGFTGVMPTEQANLPPCAPSGVRLSAADIPGRRGSLTGVLPPPDLAIESGLAVSSCAGAMDKARQSGNRMERHRIMAGQNHAEQSQSHGWPDHKAGAV